MTSHKELVAIGAEWLTRKTRDWRLKCQFAVTEFVYSGWESPDIFGIRSGKSVLIEVKVSRQDFLADKKKPFRVNDFDGLGQQRYFLVPKGLVKPEETGRWGLLEFLDGKITISKESETFDTRRDSEMNLMYSIMRRLCKPGVIFSGKTRQQ